MINLMYVVLMAMLALNVSNDVLKGFTLVGDSLQRTTDNADKENKAIYSDFAAQLKKNPAKVQAWYDQAMVVKKASDGLYNFADSLKWAIARDVDGADGNPNAIVNKEDLNAAEELMLAPVKGKGQRLYNDINNYRKLVASYVTDPRQKAIIESNLSTDVPKTPDNLGKNWQEYMFEAMPSIAAVTMLSKLQSDVRKAENEVLHTLLSNIDLKDIRVNELSAFCLPENTTFFPGEEFRSHIFMAAVDTTQRPEIFVNGHPIGRDGSYNFRVGGPGEYSFSGYIQMMNAAGELIKRDFTQKYKVIAPSMLGATVAADLMNVLYAGYDNPISVSASGISADKISLSMSGGTLTSKGNGHFIARPAHVGQDVTFTVTGAKDGKSQALGSFSFKVRKLPDPMPFIMIGDDMFKGGRLSKGSVLGVKSIGAAIDDGLLNIPFKVLNFKAVFFDRMGNAIPKPSAGANFTEDQRNSIREVRPGNRFYISEVHAIGPDGIERTLPSVLEIIVK